MKTHTLLIFLFFAFTSFTAFSQTGTSKDVGISESPKYIYCELVQQEQYFGSDNYECITFINFGTKSNYQGQIEDNKYVKSQTNGMDALNYMAQKGWELLIKNTRGFNSHGLESVYLLRKKP